MHSIAQAERVDPTMMKILAIAFLNIPLIGSFPHKSISSQKVLPDQSINLGNLDVIQLLDSILDLSLVSQKIDYENKGIVVFDLFHSRFGSQWRFDDAVLVHFVAGWHGLASILWSTSQLKGLWLVEVHLGADLHGLTMGALGNLL
jgi:hypothetical protein